MNRRRDKIIKSIMMQIKLNPKAKIIFKYKKVNQLMRTRNNKLLKLSRMEAKKSLMKKIISKN